jgi:hypothetical protein
MRRQLTRIYPSSIFETQQAPVHLVAMAACLRFAMAAQSGAAPAGGASKPTGRSRRQAAEVPARLRAARWPRCEAGCAATSTPAISSMLGTASARKPSSSTLALGGIGAGNTTYLTPGALARAADYGQAQAETSLGRTFHHHASSPLGDLPAKEREGRDLLQRLEHRTATCFYP